MFQVFILFLFCFYFLMFLFFMFIFFFPLYFVALAKAPFQIFGRQNCTLILAQLLNEVTRNNSVSRLHFVMKSCKILFHTVTSTLNLGIFASDFYIW